MSKISWCAHIFLIFAGLTATSFGASAQSTELRVAVSDFTGERVDPREGGFGMLIYHAPMFDYLVTMDTNRKRVPGVAESWSVSDDGTVYTFQIRNGMKFHNGDDVTAEDVKFSIERLKGGAGSFVGPIYDSIQEMHIADPRRLVIKLKRPFPDFLDFLGPGDTSVGAIVPKKYIEKVGDDGFIRSPIGSGPWKLVEHKPGSYFLYDAFRNHPYRASPGFDRLRISLVPEESTRVAMLQRGEADIIDLGVDSIKTVEQSGNTVLDVPDSVLVTIGFIGTWEERASQQKVPTRLENTSVRRALSLAINRRELLDFLIAGRGKLAERFPAFPGGFGFNPKWADAAMPYDPIQAKTILEQSGYRDGFSIRLYTLPLSGAPWAPKLAQVVADYWGEIGVKTEVVTTEWGAFGPIVYNRPDQALGSAYTWRVTNSSFPIGRMENYVEANGKALIALMPWDSDYSKLAAETDPKKREQMFDEMMDRLHETYAVIPIFYVDALYGAGKRITNWVPYHGWPSIGLSYEYFRPAS
jgi:peptide/nickel transport system substrate-binding protein